MWSSLFNFSAPQPPPKQVREPTHVRINSNYPIEDRIVHAIKSPKHDASLKFYGEKTIKPKIITPIIIVNISFDISVVEITTE